MLNARQLLIVLVMVAATLAGSPAPAQQGGWKPNKPVEIVVGVSPGGGIDRMARVLQKIMQERHLVEVPVNVVNKPGGRRHYRPGLPATAPG
jgi:putative tricarboxylic transport membrane protein